jgi:predicted enzyme related to lactoylglutathione lyase
MDPVQHFELPYRSRERAKKFYFDAFNWQLFDLPGSSYTLASSVATEKNGMPKRPGAINGGLTPRSDLVQGPTFMVKVGDLRSHLERIRDAGGQVLTEPEHMGPVVFARIKDTEGNVIAVFEDAPEPVRAAQEAKGRKQPGRPAKRGKGAKPATKAPAKRSANKASRKKR